MARKPRYSEPRLGPVAQKILVLLFGGLALGLTSSPDRYFRIIRTIRKDFEKINRYALHRTIRNLYRSKLVNVKENADNTVTLVLTDKGKAKTLNYNIENIKVPEMKRWDKQWRVVMFDIPERYKKSRDALSKTFKKAGFYKFQKSVFVHPFECKDEVDFVVEFFNLQPYVRYMLASHIDNELDIKQHFNL
ncbi:hypothetical protein A3C77_02580 [Candidatus Giovannonibacteria bacterium RIFCSPHIGHO2_02_FULL_45_13]|uniref:Transcriptional repressor PaaX-like central Cas2-like domain-containing protein n=1 Tax=Candidatus Giovannonibacteria bacterium RIFCSPHIGHO2_01_FULL_45_23 TaxID=1798325 RepID=A0A1F5VGU9_9BACT|nr:MAG: hypothetical protein A2834_02245 [Candidatus Giovannonibacteria bacterium RIFCSPHIGHO2_01_FULL_45_23]OGF75042.1 MAG: hypothetical protein A3C77_02580 [Candidatus Giovannonibacteria bacterium RIFCSPHIGHO2_02_FULL_45_13]